MPLQSPLNVFELRAYRTHPGRRDDLIAMFETHFCPAYEAAGATILASWTVLEEPDRWVWIRAFPDGASRRRALDGFYGGGVWAELADRCRATIADARTAFLLRAERAFDLANPPGRDALPMHLQRTWAATLMPLAAPLPAADPDDAALQLASARHRLWLRRFETAAADAAFHAALGSRSARSGVRHWRLEPTACSRLR